MPSITRAQVAARVHEKLDKLAADLKTATDGARTEGDYTYPLDEALRDCGLDAITEADSHARIRAVLLGTEYRAMQRLFWRRSVMVSQTQGAGYASSQQSLEWNNLLEILRRRLKDVQAEYELALNAIGASLSQNVEAGSAAGVVLIDDDDDTSKELVDSGLDVGLPWFREGYNEVGD